MNVLDEDVGDTEDSSGVTGIIDKDDRINKESVRKKLKFRFGLHMLAI